MWERRCFTFLEQSYDVSDHASLTVFRFLKFSDPPPALNATTSWYNRVLFICSKDCCCLWSCVMSASWWCCCTSASFVFACTVGLRLYYVRIKCLAILNHLAEQLLHIMLTSACDLQYIVTGPVVLKSAIIFHNCIHS